MLDNSRPELRPFDLVPLRSLGNGNCLLNSVSIAMWGVNDRRLHGASWHALRVVIFPDQASRLERPVRAVAFRLVKIHD